MMYNRYIPDANGIYSRQSVPETTKQPEKTINASSSDDHKSLQEPKPNVCVDQASHKTEPFGFDTGDLLLLCIILLVLLDSEEEDLMTIFITAAAFLFLQ